MRPRFNPQWSTQTCPDMHPDVVPLGKCGEDGVVQESGCFAVWSDQDTKIYFTTLFIVAFVIPGVVLCAFYLRMLCKYWLPAGRPIGEVTSRATESRKKVAKMVSLILVVFWLCYLPFWILQMLMFHGHEVIGSSISYEALYYLRFVLQNLSYINACANPFLYTLLSDKYKAILKGILTMKGTPRHPVVHRTMTTHSSIELNSMRRSHVTDRSHVATHNPSPMFGTPHVRRSFYTIRERSSSEENDAMNIRA
ncbi:UTS2R [Branchiostoma lanceolatum]|uniref:UTS2R protein n=1 Tax=Branchiostoma lanceolatum TaxID=7740 RepID=A0A8K0ABP2_BRALA|nr:UTS2R [Branchiostoma lanceolatum]